MSVIDMNTKTGVFMPAVAKDNSAEQFDAALDFYPFGFQYHRAPTPLPEEWDDDLKSISAKGYTHIQFRPQWRWHERIRGVRKWDDLDKLFELAAKNKLSVVLKPMLETAPDWVFRDLNGSRIGFHGVPISPFAHGAYYVGGWWPCFDNPGVVMAASDFVRELVGRYKSHPALWLYDAWNEPVSRPLGQCHCVHSKASYREWLRRGYGSIEHLNEKYGKAWTSFETIDPPASGADYLELFLWRKWAAYAVSEQVRFVAESIRAVDGKAHIMVHVGSSLIRQDAICNVSDDFLNRAAGVDRYGTSFWVPLHPKLPVEHAAPERQSSWLRRIDPSYWCHEFYPNHGNWCVPPDKTTLRRLVWTAIAGGAAGFTFWQYRSERVGCETNGFGLMNIDGSSTERSEVADSIALSLRRHSGGLAVSKRIPSGIAILYSHDSDMISRIQKLPDGIDSLAGTTGTGDYPYKNAIAAAHTLYHFLGLEPDWVVPGDNLDNCKLLHVTCAEMIDERTAVWLEKFVIGGGRLIVEFPFACRDERTWVSLKRPALNLDRLLGCVELERVQASSSDVFVLDVIDKILLPAVWRIALEKFDSSEVIGRWNDGKAAAILNSYGKGVTLALGGSLSLGGDNSWNSDSFLALKMLLMRMGVKVPRWAGSGLVVHRRQGNDSSYHFVFNCSDTEQSVEMPFTSATALDSEFAVLAGAKLTLGPGGMWIGETKE